MATSVAMTEANPVRLEGKYARVYLALQNSPTLTLGYRQIGALVGTTDNGVRDALRRLHRLGLVTWTNGGGMNEPNTYTLHGDPVIFE